MLLDVGDDDTDVEEEGETIVYDANCNTSMHRRGHMRRGAPTLHTAHLENHSAEQREKDLPLAQL